MAAPAGDGVTVITGASGGIGAALARRVLAEGGRVVNLSDRPSAALPGAIDRIVDLTDVEATREAFEAVLDEHRVTGFVHCAGVPHMGPVEAFDAEGFDRIVHLHLRAAMQCVGLVVPAMKARRHGHIVLLGSRVSLGRVRSSLYGAVKFGILGMAPALAVELAPHGINVNVVSPGPVDTPMLRVYHPAGSAQAQALEASIPMGRVAQPEDVANAAMFFLRDETSYVTGQNLFVCGGRDIAAAEGR